MLPLSKLLAVGFFERLYLIECDAVAISGLMELILYVRDLVRSHLTVHYNSSFTSAVVLHTRAEDGDEISILAPN